MKPHETKGGEAMRLDGEKATGEALSIADAVRLHPKKPVYVRGYLSRCLLSRQRLEFSPDTGVRARTETPRRAENAKVSVYQTMKESLPAFCAGSRSVRTASRSCAPRQTAIRRRPRLSARITRR